MQFPAPLARLTCATIRIRRRESVDVRKDGREFNRRLEAGGLAVAGHYRVLRDAAAARERVAVATPCGGSSLAATSDTVCLDRKPGRRCVMIARVLEGEIAAVRMSLDDAVDVVRASVVPALREQDG